MSDYQKFQEAATPTAPPPYLGHAQQISMAQPSYPGLAMAYPHSQFNSPQAQINIPPPVTSLIVSNDRQKGCWCCCCSCPFWVCGLIFLFLIIAGFMPVMVGKH